MKIGISQLIANELEIGDFLRQAGAAGYQAVEFCMKQKGAITPETGEDTLREISAEAKSCGMEVVSLTLNHLTGNLLADGRERETGIAETVTGLRAAATMGARTVLHTLGRFSPELYYDDAYRNAVGALQELAGIAEEMRISIAIEFIWNGFLFSPLEMKHFLAEVRSPAVGFYFDPGNMAVFQYPQHWARILAKSIKLVHMKDWQGKALSGGWTRLMRGEVDFPTVMRELKAGGYAGPLISEVSLAFASMEETAGDIAVIAGM